MKTRTEQLDYVDLQTIIANARMERSVAVADAIASGMAAVLSGLSRAMKAIKSGASGLKSRAEADSAPILDASGRR